jgi:hypothetical protein
MSELEREPQDVHLAKDHHNRPTLQFNQNEPLATVPTMKEQARRRGSEGARGTQTPPRSIVSISFTHLIRTVGNCVAAGCDAAGPGR